MRRCLRGAVRLRIIGLSRMTAPGVPPPSEQSVPPAPRAGVAAGGPPPALERVLLDLQDAGLAPSLVERAVSWWKRYGGRRAALFALAVTLPVLRYEYVPYVLSSAVETMAAGYGLELTVGEWESSLTDIKVVGKDVVVTSGGPFRETRLFQADAIEFDWSLSRAVANGWTRVKGCWTVVFLQPCTLPEEVFHRIIVHDATLHLERTMAGAWNTAAAFDIGTLDDLSSQVQGWRFPAIEGRNVTVSWVEQLPGDSGGGLLERRFSTLDFSKVTVGVANLQVPVDDRDNPTRFTFDGQTADGQLSVAGVLNVSRWTAGTWTPSYDLSFTLANVGAATIGRFAAPDASVVPKTGTVDGTLRVASDGRRFTVCRIDVALRDVTYIANPRSPYSRTGGRTLEQQLEPVRINEVVSRDCNAPADLPGPRTLPPTPDPGMPPRVVPAGRRTSETLQTMVTSTALQDGPPLVRGAASFDEAAVVGGQTLTPEQITADISAQLGQAIGGDRGAAVARALTAKDGTGGNAVSRGARSAGRGIRRLFGGGSKPATKKPPSR
jgi:hypothetical protein